jgi:hypothetical protein
MDYVQRNSTDLKVKLIISIFLIFKLCRFRGKYLSVVPIGHTHVHFKNSGNHYTFPRVTTTVHNIIVGKLWIDNHGEMLVNNHATGDKGIIKFNAYNYFTTEKARKVES